MLFLGLLLQTPPVTIDLIHTKPISPYIYGANNMQWGKMGSGYPLVRQGGNRMTAYNWETNASNAGSDWHHQNDDYLAKSNEAGYVPGSYMKAAHANHAAVLITVPTIGYVAADKKGDGDVNKTPNYLSTRFLKSYAKKPGGKYIYPPDTKDRAVYQDEFVAWMERSKPAGQPIWYSLDNEPDLWANTHERIHPKKLTYAELIENNIEYGRAIKSVAPKALVFGPANYGWQGFRVLQDAPDANKRDFLNTYLDAMKTAEKSSGKRVLDVLDIHWYPEARGNGFRITDDSPKTAGLDARMQAPRSLWDPGYVETSWIADSLGKKPIALLPRVMKQIADHYPGTKLAITEYNYGGAKDPSGTVAQADVLGIFGKYGLFAACNWGISPDSPAQIAGFAAYLNYDGKGSKFGDLGLDVSGVNTQSGSVYAALSSKNRRRLTVVFISKSSPLSTDVRFKSPVKSCRGFLMNPTNPSQPRALPVKKVGDGWVVGLPPQSVATVEFSL